MSFRHALPLRERTRQWKIKCVILTGVNTIESFLAAIYRRYCIIYRGHRKPGNKDTAQKFGGGNQCPGGEVHRQIKRRNTEQTVAQGRL